MTRTGDTMVARRENVTHTFAFRAKGGDDDTMPWHAVEVTKLPRLTSLAITVHPPAYSGLPAARLSGILMYWPARASKSGE